METSSLILAECQQTNEDRRRVKMRIKRRNSSLKAEIQDICVFKRFLCLLFALSQHFPFPQLPENGFLSKKVSQKCCLQLDPFTGL